MAPSNPFCVAVIGCGGWGQNLARNFHDLGALSALYDVHEDKAASLVQRYGLPNLNFEQILNDRGIAGIAIAASSAQHYELAKKAMAFGKHVFVEKPMTLSLASAEDLAAIADREKRILMVGHLLHYHPAFLKLLDMVCGGELGTLKYIYANRLNLGRIQTLENCLWDLAPHDLSMILALAQKEPLVVRTERHESIQQGLIDTATIHLEFQGGLKAHAFLSWVHPFKEHRLSVLGSKGMAVFDDVQPWASKLVFHAYETRLNHHHLDIFKAPPIAVEVQADEPLKRECQHFLDCMRTLEQPRTGSHEALKVMRILEKAQASYG